MIKNYFRIALRSLRKNKVFAFINVFGMATGLACCMLIAVYVYEEFNYDNYAANAKQIYRVNLGTGETSYPMVDVAVGPGIKNAFPEVKDYCRLSTTGETFVQYGDNQFKEQKLVFADGNFLQVFSIPFLEGDAKTSLTEPNSIVITKAFAKKYFGNEQATGKILKVDGRGVFKVTGIIEKVPDNSHFHFDAFMSMSTLPPMPQTWSNVNFYTYLLLDKNTSPKELEAKFPQLVSKYVVPEIQRDMGVSLEEAQKTGTGFRFVLQPVTDIHLHSSTKYELEANADINYVYIFGALAIFVLLIACVNFINLSTANSVKRSREVGIRKVLGSVKGQLINQFLTESILLTFCAMLLALGIIFIVLPYFNQLAGQHVRFYFFIGIRSVVAELVLCLMVGVLAGIYPAFFLSSFNTIAVLKSTSSVKGGHKSIFRNSLVVFQFFISTALIIATIIIYQQLHFMQNKKLGYDKDQLVYLQDTHLLGNNQKAFRQALLRDNRVQNASMGRNVPGNGIMSGTEISAKGTELNKNSAAIPASIFHIDEEYVPTLGLQVIRGRNFSKNFPTDSSAVVINETAVRDLGWANTDPIGKTIIRSGQKEFKVIGVVADFHYASVKQKIAPLMMLLGNNWGGIIVKVKTSDAQGFLADTKKQWTSLNPSGPFAYYFLDDKFASLYSAEQRTGKIFSAFTIIAIVIASLGLFGLSAFIIEQRTKEIGIRKVLGASVAQVLMLVSKEFLLLMSIAFIFSIPVTWWGMHIWLQDFAYRINISWWVFLLAGIGASIIALITISFQAIKAALANPVKSLRTE